MIIGANVSGNYSGDWSIPEDEEAAPCPMTMELVHYPNANNLEDATLVTGVVSLDFTCFPLLDSILLFQPIEVGEISVTGYSVAGGILFLRSEDLVGGCNGDLCISLILSGTAIDEDGDGNADTLSGEWSALFPVAASGVFEVAIDDEM